MADVNVAGLFLSELAAIDVNRFAIGCRYGKIIGIVVNHAISRYIVYHRVPFALLCGLQGAFVKCYVASKIEKVQCVAINRISTPVFYAK